MAAAAAALQALLLVVAAIYALLQLREARRARRVTAVLPIFERLHSREATERRRRLYQEIAPRFPDLNTEQEAVMQEVISEFYFVGYLVDQHLVEFELVAELYFGTVVRCWRACEPYILRDRERRGTPYASYFESFYKRCLDYGRRRHPDEIVRTFALPSPIEEEGTPSGIDLDDKTSSATAQSEVS